MRKVFRGRRPDTSLINLPNTGTLHEFINHLNTAEDITKPISDLHIGAHANATGELFLPMFRPSGDIKKIKKTGITTFERLQETMDSELPDRSIRIPDKLVLYDDNLDLPLTDVRIWGCNLGKARPFLVKLKEALGGRVWVTALKHHLTLSDERSSGIIEFADYQYRILRKEALPSLEDVIGAFKEEAEAGRCLLIDGNPPSKDKWTEWIAASEDEYSEAIKKETIPGREKLVFHSKPKYDRLPLGVSLGRLETAQTESSFKVFKSPFEITLSYEREEDIPEFDKRLEELKTVLSDNPLFQRKHDYPMYERWGYDDFEQFLSGWVWDEPGKWRSWRKEDDREHPWKLTCRGWRFEYLVEIPITDNKGHLIFNFYPDPGSPHEAITTGLQPFASFFERV